jgi:hypothetical protein
MILPISRPQPNPTLPLFLPHSTPRHRPSLAVLLAVAGPNSIARSARDPISLHARNS